MNRMLLVSAVLASLTILVTGLAVVNAANPTTGHRGAHRWGPPMLNQSQTTASESVIEGVLTDADWAYIEVKSGQTTYLVAAPRIWQLNGRATSFFKLFAEDQLNIGDNVKVTAVTITFTKPNGATVTITYAKHIVDLDTGVEVTALRRPDVQQPFPNNT
ncbi:MAG: hypothetical protein RMI49_00375 [Candidatus Caldarchaeum sp.]|nr:hypothetical protein [Candidatus Caldarchaeum sp.]